MKSWIWKTEIFALDLRGRVFYYFYVLSSSTSITITKQRNSLLGICHTPSQRGGGEKVISYFIYISSKSCTIKKLRWSTRYSWLNRCNSSEYYSWKVALGPRRSGLTDELLKNGIWLYFFKAMVWLNILCNSMVGVRNHPGHLYHGKIIVGVLKY